MNLTLDFTKASGVINPNLHGHFSEHIGGVFYDGLWVGEDSKVENVRGFRKSLVDSFKKSRLPCCAGRADALPKPMTGATASAPAQADRAA